MSGLVTTTEHEQQKYILLEPGVYPARTGPTYQLQCSADIQWIIREASQSQYLAVDFETRGNDVSDKILIVGLGLAWDTGSCYLHWDSLYEREEVLDLLAGHPGLLAHNVYFDGGVAAAYKVDLQWHACTLALYQLLHNESPENKHGLKLAMTDMLGWTDSNEHDLDEWLVVNGHYIGVRRVDNSPEVLRLLYQQGSIRPDKSEMWRAPADILGKYCVLDAEACYLLYTQVLLPTVERFPELNKYFHERWMPHIEIHIRQKLLGIAVDRAGLLDRARVLEEQVLTLTQEFINIPEVNEHVVNIEKLLREPKLSKSPPQLRKDGGISKNYIKWREQCEVILNGGNPDYNFNINSGDQLRAVLYDGMGFDIRIRTDSGLPSTGRKAYIHMGDYGQLLQRRADVVKELSYINKYIELTSHRNSIHPGFRIPGPVTGRVSSNNPNITQIPKSQAVMSLFKAPPGHVFVDIDFAALESVVAAEFSQDPNLLALYGDGVPENDIHLFVAASVPGEMGDAVRRTGYTPINPPPGTVSKAKKECKHWRSIAKSVVYSCQFGAGVNKVMQVLEEDDVFLPYEQVDTIHSTYWSTFGGLKDLGKSLWYEWRRNKGYIFNGIGRPMAVPEHYTKDLLSRFIQSTGHDILVIYVSILMGVLEERNIPWQPVIMDLHDACTIAVPLEYEQDGINAMNAAMGKLNQELNGYIRMRGKPTSGLTLADCKEPEE